jgi:hypothetical protein
LKFHETITKLVSMSKAQTEGTRPSAEQLLALADTFEAEVEGLKQEWDSLNARIGRQQRLVNDLRREAEAMGGRLFVPPAATPPDVPTYNDNGKPGTSDAIIAVLEAKGAPVSGTEVFDELERRGWLPTDAKSPRNAVRASLWTLGKNGKIDSLGDSPASRRWAAKTSSPQVDGPGGDEDHEVGRATS